MSQTGYISFFLIVGFIVFITIKGELPSYLAILFGSTQTGSSNAGTLNPTSQLGTGTGNSITSGPSTIQTGISSNDPGVGCAEFGTCTD